MALLVANAMSYGGAVGRTFGSAATSGGHRKESLSGTGPKLNWCAGWHTVSGVSDRTAIPDGAQHPIAWTFARKSGGLSSHSLLGVTVTPGPSLAVSGRAIAGTTALSLTVPDATAQLLAFLVGSTSATLTLNGAIDGVRNDIDGTTAWSLELSGTLDGVRNAIDGTTALAMSLSGSLVGVRAAVGEATINLSASASVGALAGIFGDIGLALTAGATPSAIGNLEGAIVPYTELSPQSLAQAVWAAQSDSNHDAGSMGELLLGAGGGSSPTLIAEAVWDTLVAGHLGAGSFGEAMALARGLAQHNYILDQPTYNGSGALLSARVRIFPTKADTDAGTNAIATLTVAATASGALGQTLKVTRDP